MHSFLFRKKVSQEISGVSHYNIKHQSELLDHPIVKFGRAAQFPKDLPSISRRKKIQDVEYYRKKLGKNGS